MKEIAEEVLKKYFQEKLLFALPTALIAGFAGMKSVAPTKRSNPVFYLIVGLLGSFLGQFTIRYLGIKEILDELPHFWFLFDFLTAYAGSFAIASLLHFVKPW